MPCSDFVSAIFEHSSHALSSRCGCDFAVFCTSSDSGSHIGGSKEEFEDAGTPFETGSSTFGAAASLSEAWVGESWFETKRDEFIVVGCVRLEALDAVEPDESLCHDGDADSSSEIGLCSHVEHSSDSLDGVIGVDGGKDEVSRECGLDADVERLGVSHFSDHHDVWVLPEEGSHDSWESHFLGDLYLCDVVAELVLDGVFDGDDVSVFSVEL